MDQNAKPSLTGLPDDIFNSLPESIRYYIRFLKSRIQQIAVLTSLE